MINVILIEPEHPGNVGAIARVMKNFGFSNLILINPSEDIINEQTKCRAKHAQDVLVKAKIVDHSFLDKMDYIIATTARLGSEYNLPRVPLNPKQLSEKINSLSKSKNKLNIGLVFGREGIGLRNEEVEKADFIVNIPGNKKYPVLNLSHAVGIILYELYKAKDNKPMVKVEMADKKYKDKIMDMVEDTLDKIGFTTPTKRSTQTKGWTKILGKSLLTKREAFVVFGFFKKLNEKLK